MPPRDPRLVVGSTVSTKATFVTSKAECCRRYGALWQTKVVKGIVESVLRELPRASAQKRETYVVARYDLGGGVTKVAKINLRSILKDVIGPAVNLSTDMQNAAVPAAATAVNNNATPAAAINNINSAGVPVNNNATLAATNNNINSAGVPVNNNATPAAANNNINSAGVPVNNNATPAAGNIIAAINSLLADSTCNQPALETPPEQDYQQVEDLFVGPAPVAIVHDREWFQDDERLKNDLRRPVRPREWSINTPLGDVIHAGSDANFTRSRLDYFLLMFPLPHLNNIVRLTNSELTTLNKRETTAGEVLKFFGILILISKFEFSA
jgi:hypothetical protein